MKSKIPQTLVSKTPLNKINLKVNWTIRKKLGLIIIVATFFSLLMGAPIAFIQHALKNSGILDSFGSKVSTLIQTYFTLISNLIILVSFMSFGVKKIVVKPIQEVVDGIQSLVGEEINLSYKFKSKRSDEIHKLFVVFPLK